MRVFILVLIVCNASNVLSLGETCNALQSTSTTFVTCKRGGSIVNCSEAISGTVAMYTCPNFYELSSNKNVLYCSDGSWDSPKPICKPACGRKPIKQKELILENVDVKGSTSSNPWSVAIYSKYDDNYRQICGGTLISQRVILTAAHCVSDRDGKIGNASIYIVAAGKYYTRYDDPRDANMAQFAEVEAIFISKNYKGDILDYQADIAAIVTKIPFNTTKFVQRVCVDWTRDSDDESKLVGSQGVVTGWGHTIQEGTSSEVLKEISVPYLDFSTCWDQVPSSFRKYLRPDKLCTGFSDKGASICLGDSGGGLVFVNSSGDKRYYLRGIVSVSPQTSGICENEQYSIHTRVSSYIDFISSILHKYDQ